MANSLTPQNSVKDKKLDIQIHKEDTYPMSVYFAAGSQNGFSKNENKIYVFKWSEMEKTVDDDKELSENSSDDDEDIMEK